MKTNKQIKVNETNKEINKAIMNRTIENNNKRKKIK